MRRKIVSLLLIDLGKASCPLLVHLAKRYCSVSHHSKRLGSLCEPSRVLPVSGRKKRRSSIRKVLLRERAYYPQSPNTRLQLGTFIRLLHLVKDKITVKWICSWKCWLRLEIFTEYLSNWSTKIRRIFLINQCRLHSIFQGTPTDLGQNSNERPRSYFFVLYRFYVLTFFLQWARFQVHNDHSIPVWCHCMPWPSAFRADPTVVVISWMLDPLFLFAVSRNHGYQDRDLRVVAFLRPHCGPCGAWRCGQTRWAWSGAWRCGQTRWVLRRMAVQKVEQLNWRTTQDKWRWFALLKGSWGVAKASLSERVLCISETTHRRFGSAARVDITALPQIENGRHSLMLHCTLHDVASPVSCSRATVRAKRILRSPIRRLSTASRSDLSLSGRQVLLGLIGKPFFTSQF